MIAFVIAEALFFANFLVWFFGSGHPWWVAPLWLAAMPVLYVVQKWILE